MYKEDKQDDMSRNGSNVKVKVKVTLEQAMKAHMWSRGIALLFLQLRR
jgi:hypothetical protein